MPSVSDLSIKLQTGSDNTYFASWKFNETVKATSTTTFKAGDLVSIKAGATYYNGVAIPNWVKNQKWYLLQVRGDRAVLGKNESGTNNIVSAINTNSLEGGSSSTTTSGVDPNTLDHYTVEWFYDTGDGIWFTGNSSDVKEQNATYGAPSNAIVIKVVVTPVSKTYKVNDTDTSYWTGTAVSKTYALSADPPEKTATPTVEVDQYRLTASLENISDPRTDEVKFEIYNGTTLYNTGTVTVLTCQAAYSCSVEAGGQYRVRSASINIDNNTRIYGAWSDFSSAIGTIPSTPSGITDCRASSETSVHLEWAEVASAESYDIEYTTKLEYFDGSDQTTTTSGITTTKYEKTGLETGEEYFFRIRAVNDKGQSAWTSPRSVILGKKPEAPTTWSSTTTAVTGEPLNLYWVHNAEDGSSQTFAELEMYIDGVENTLTIKNTEDEEERDKTSVYAINTAAYKEGTTIQWRVRTAGITKTYGEWSIQRTVDIYAPATLRLSVTDIDGNALENLRSLPFYVAAIAGPRTQSPISYHLSIIADEQYRTVDQVGQIKMVNAGEEVYSKYYDISESLVVELSAGDLSLVNNVSYTVICTVAMNSGLTAESSTSFTVDWNAVTYEPDAEIGVDMTNYTAYIRPYCLNEDGTLTENVRLSVYRREFDGTFVELASNIDNARNIHITDPHPALDFARYRIVATSVTTGSVSFYDPPGYPVRGKEAVIQWDEAWSTFETLNGDQMEEQPWAGSLLKLPYNVDVSDNSNVDVTLVNYIGRSHPVSYYGTQLGSTSSWNMVVPKYDKETVYALRRLQNWTGDVYVREPSGSGYWANISVSFSQNHGELTIPVSLNVTRVEGEA